MKKLFTFLFALTASIGVINAQSGTCGDNLTWELNAETGILTISGTGAMTSSPFRQSYSSAIKTVIINDGVTSIGGAAFYNCSSLTSVTIPNSVTSIGDNAFYNCSPLTSITIPNSVTSIGDGAFSGCSSLTSVTIGNSVTSIGEGAFYNCSSLTSVTIGNSVTSIGEGAFVKTGIYNNAANWENGVLYINDCLIKAKQSVSGAYIIKEGTRLIGRSAFYDCSSLTSVTFEGRTPPSIDRDVFYNTNNCPIYVPCGTKDAYVTVLNENNTIDESRVIETVIASGYCGVDSTNLTWELSCDSVLTISGTGVMMDLEGPRPINNDLTDSTSHITQYDYSKCAPWYIDKDKIKIINISEGVTNIGAYAFYDCSNLEEVSNIPNSVVSIGSNAFWGCRGLTSITIPSNVLSIGDIAFDGCESLTSVTISNGVQTIGRAAFVNCSKISSILIPKTVTNIGEQAFAFCDSLTSIVVEDGNTKYDSRNNCNAIIEKSSNTLIQGCKTTIIPNNIISIGKYAFISCKGLANIEIPNSVTTIGESAFSKCRELTSIVIPNSVKTIESSAFSSCSTLTSIVIGTNVTNIGSYAFYSSKVSSIIIPEKVKNIGVHAFTHCKSLIDVTIKANIPPTLGGVIFYGCDELSSIYVPCNRIAAYQSAWTDYASIIKYAPNSYLHVAVNDSNAGIVSYPIDLTVCDNSALIEAVPSDGYNFVQWSDGAIENPRTVVITQDTTFTAIFEPAKCLLASGTCGAEGDNLTWELSCDSVLTISGTGAMADYASALNVPWYGHRSAIKTILINDGVTSIGKYAFEDCSSLTSVTIPNSVTSIGERAFFSCSSLTSVTIPNSVTSIEDNAFAWCSSLTSVTIGNSVTSIGGGAFYGCSSLTSITIPNSVTSIGSRAFYNCSSLTSINVDSNNPNYSSVDGVLFNKDKTTLIAYPGGNTRSEYTIPNSVTSIGDYAFWGCSSLTSITIPNSVTRIGSSAFYGCNKLRTIEIPYSVFEIGSSCFAHCSSLTAFTIPDSLSTINDNIFDGCRSLTSIEIPDGFDNAKIQNIGVCAFRRCSSLTNVTIGESVNYINADAFFNDSALSSITCKAINPPTLSSSKSGVFYGVDKSIPLYVPCASIESYKAADGWSGFTNIQAINPDDCGPCLIASGYCGADSTNLTWELSCDSVLTISGTGAMEDGECIDDPLGDLPIPDEDNDNSSVIVSDPVKSIIIKEGVTTIGVSAFWGRSSLTSVTIPNTVTSIGNGAFRSCTSLSSVYITDIAAWCRISTTGKDLSGMGINECELSNPFHYADNLYLNGELVTDLVIPNSVTRIEPHVFNSCSCLTSVTIGDSVNSIGDFAFAYCKGLTSVTFGNSVTSIGWQAFDGCESLTSVTIPSSVTSIGDFAFYNCSSLTSVTFEGRTPPLMEYAFYVNDNCSFYVPCGTKDAYVAALNVNNTIDESRVIEIVIASGYCGADSTNLTWELSCDSVLTISGTGAMADYAYASITPWYGHRSAIKTILINDGVTSIGDNAFYGCKSLTSVTIGNSVTSIGNSAFSDCWRLDALQLPESVTSIGNSAFAGCFRFRNIHIPKNVSSIGTCLFQYCSKLVSITVDTENPIYDSRDNCNAIIETSTNVLVEGSNATHIPETVVAIGKSAFANKNGFRQIDIPNSITSIGGDAFINCDTLESLVVPTSVSYMGRSAFYQCSGLKTVEFKSVTPPNIDNRYMGGTCFLGTTCDFLVPCGTKEAYVIALNYQSVSDSIDESRVIESEELMFDYTISSDNTLGSVTITQEPTCTAPLIFRADAAEGYQFAQWSDGNTDNPRSLILTQDTTIKAEFELCSYTVTWLNYDSLVLELDTNVIYGTMPSYDSAVPVKPSTAEYTYTFAGWSPVVESVTGNTTYIAVFDEVLNAYTVTWLNYDSLVLESDTNVAYGTMPSYDSTLPAKPSTAEYTYTFAGWSPEVVAATEDATYTATYTSALRMYSVLVYGINDNIILNGTYPYGESVLVEAIPEQNYQFAQWSDGNTDNPRSLILTQDTVLKALFEQIIIEQDTIIVKDSTDISDIITGGQDTIPHVEVQPGGEITIDRDDIGIGVITIITIGTESGQVHPWDGGYDNLKNTRVVMEYVLEPLKQQADPNKWYAFAVPFEVDIETGVTRKYGNKSHVPGKDFMILEYDSELRSKTGKGWVEKKSGSLTPGHIYMLGIEGNCNRWLFEKVREADVVGNKEKDLKHDAHGNSKNNGWHGLGNTTLEYVDMSFSIDDILYILVYDNQHSRYITYHIDELVLAVGQPFFVQTTQEGASVVFEHNNGKGKGNGKKNMPIYAPSYDVQPTLSRVRFTIENENINATPDRLYITLHDDNLSGSYIIGRDLMRMDKGSKQVPNFWCPMADGTQLSAHGVTMPTTYTTIPLGIFTPAKGEYTINAHMQDMDDYIVELYYQNVCLGIVMQGVPFRLEMAVGTSYEYSIRISRRVSTDLNPAEDTQCDKDNKWYDVLGRPLPQDAHGIFIRKGEKIIK